MTETKQRGDKKQAKAQGRSAAARRWRVFFGGWALLAAGCLGDGPVEVASEEGLARDPLVVPSLGWAHEQILVGSDRQEWNRFGQDVAVCGATAVVGAPLHNFSDGPKGAAFVFVREGGEWTRVQMLVASNGGEFDHFGISVDISGDWIIVGAPYEAYGGAAYLFQKSGDQWIERKRLSGHEDHMNFGHAVALDGDRALVGAPHSYGDGAAYVFRRFWGLWILDADLSTGEGDEDRSFGQSVALYGDTVLVGAPYEYVEDMARGAAYVFDRTGGQWGVRRKLSIPDGGPLSSDNFGHSVALSSDRAVVGNRRGGAAYVFSSSGDLEQQLIGEDVQPGDSFGHSVAIDGTTIVVGAVWHDAGDDLGTGRDIGANLRTGGAFLFRLSGGQWIEQEKLVGPHSDDRAEFGASVGISSSVVFVGAPGQDENQGVAHVFRHGLHFPRP